jgi:hypothetical protein
VEVSSPYFPSLVRFPPGLDSEQFPFLLSLGTVNGVGRAGRYAFLATDQGLTVLDVSSPPWYEEIAALPFPGGFNGLVMEGSTLYLSSEDGRVQVVDVSVPLVPRAASAFALAEPAAELTVSNGSLFTVSPKNGLRIFDISDSGAAVETGSLALSSAVQGLELVGDLLYLAAADGLHIVDVSNPALPVETGSFDALNASGAAEPVDAAVLGQYAYLADRVNGLWVLDVSDPSAPKPAGLLPLAALPRRLVVVGNTLYATVDSGLFAWDISNAGSPAAGGHFPTPELPRSLLADGESLFLSAGSLWVLQTNPAGLPAAELQPLAPDGPAAEPAPEQPASLAVELIGRIPAEYSQAVAAADELVFLGKGRRLAILDASDLASPRQVWESPELPGEVIDLAVSGRAALVLVEEGEASSLHLFDVSRPAEAYRMGSERLAARAWEVTAAGNTAFVAAENGLHLYTLSGREPPQRLSSLEGFARGLALGKDLAALAGGENGLVLVNIADPASPFLSGSAAVQEEGAPAVLDVSGSGGYTSAVLGDGSAAIYDTLNPNRTGVIGIYEPQWPAIQVVQAGPFSLLLKEKGLEVLDISNASEPRHAARYALNGSTQITGYVLDAAAVMQEDGEERNLVVFLAGEGGVEVLRISLP